MSYFDDQDHMDFAGEFTFRVNETCLSSDHNIFRVAPTDRDAHNPILVHLKPSDMIWSEKRAYTPYEMKRRRHQKRKGEREATRATGMLLVMVVPQLHHPEHGDRSECILL